jgi:hypothetical protein
MSHNRPCPPNPPTLHINRHALLFGVWMGMFGWVFFLIYFWRPWVTSGDFLCLNAFMHLHTVEETIRSSPEWFLSFISLLFVLHRWINRPLHGLLYPILNFSYLTLPSSYFKLTSPLVTTEPQRPSPTPGWPLMKIHHLISVHSVVFSTSLSTPL